MGFNTALSGAQLTLLRGASHADDYLVTLCSNTVVFAGQITPAISSFPSWAALGYGSVTVGAYTDVEVGQAILIGTVNDITKATWRGRIRKAPTNTILYTNEAALNIANNSYFWVINTYDPVYRLNHPSTSDPSTAVQWVDFDITYQSMQPAIIGIRTAYVGSGAISIAFDASSSYAATSGATISSYQYTFKAGTYTVTAGALNTSQVTVTINDSTEQWGKLVVTDSNGITATRRFFISTMAATTGFEGLKISCALGQGWTISATAFTGADSILSDTLAVVWRANETFNGSANTLVSNNIAALGWFVRETDAVRADANFSVLSESPFEFVGIGTKLARMAAQSLPFVESASPSLWGDITNLTVWRAIKNYLDYYTTVTTLCQLDFDSHDNTFLFPTIITQGSSALDCVNGIAAEINAVIEIAQDGRILFAREYTYLTSSQRSALTTVAPWQSQDAIDDISLNNENRSTGKVTGVGAFSNSSSSQVTAWTSLAPGMSDEGGSGTATLDNQILATGTNPATALSEFLQRTGDKLEYVNNNTYLDVTHPGSYAPVLIPSHSEYWTWTLNSTLAGANGVNRIIFDTTSFWTLESVSIDRIGVGAGTVKCRYHYVQAIGSPALNTTALPVDTVLPAVPDLGIDAFDFELPELYFPDTGLLPTQVTPAQLANPPGLVAKRDGSVVAIANATKVYLLKNVIALKTPQSYDITPPNLGSYQIKQVLFDPFSTNTALGCYVLANDGTNSIVCHCSNVCTSVPVWTQGTAYAGVYNVIRGTKTAGSVLIYSSAPSSVTTTTYDAAHNLGTAWATLPSNPYGTYNSGAGQWEATAAPAQKAIYIYIDFSIGTTVLEVTARCTYTNETTPGDIIRVTDGPGFTGTVLGTTNNPSGNVTSQTFTLSGNFSTARSCLVAINDVATASIDRITVTTGSGNATVRYSTDYGATFGSAVTVGTTPGTVGGFDIQKAGTVSYAAAGTAIYKASTLGGAYSLWYSTADSSNVVCLVIPYYKRNSTTLNTSTSTPDVIAVTTTGKVLWVDGAAATATDITPTGSTAGNNANCLTVSYGHHLLAFLQASGSPRLFRSTNAGTAWTNAAALTNPAFIRCRRGDTRAATSGTNKGQGYIIQSAALDYSSVWFNGGTLNPRTLPTTGFISEDIWG